MLHQTLASIVHAFRHRCSETINAIKWHSRHNGTKSRRIVYALSLFGARARKTSGSGEKCGVRARTHRILDMG